MDKKLRCEHGADKTEHDNPTVTEQDNPHLWPYTSTTHDLIIGQMRLNELGTREPTAYEAAATNIEASTERPELEDVVELADLCDEAFYGQYTNSAKVLAQIINQVRAASQEYTGGDDTMSDDYVRTLGAIAAVSWNRLSIIKNGLARTPNTVSSDDRDCFARIGME